MNFPVLYHSADYIAFPWNHWAYCSIFENGSSAHVCAGDVSTVANFITAYEGS